MNNFQENINQILLLQKGFEEEKKKCSKARELEEGETSNKQKCPYIPNHDLANTKGYFPITTMVTLPYYMQT